MTNMNKSIYKENGEYNISINKAMKQLDMFRLRAYQDWDNPEDKDQRDDYLCIAKAMECMERQKPKKVKNIESFDQGVFRYIGICPSCEDDSMLVFDSFNYCPVCGQRLNWG